MGSRTTTVGRRPRLAASLLVGLVAALLAWSPVFGAISWGTAYKSSNDYAYTWGRSLARTATTAGTAYLHQVATRERIGGVWVSNTGPYLGVYYKRGNASGSSWGTAKRLNSTSQHGDLATIAKSGKYVYVAWRRQHAIGSSYDPGAAPRSLEFRRNTLHGSSSYWQTAPTFLGANYIDRPSIAATGSKVFIVYTDASGGEIRYQRSADYGKTWTLGEAIGATTADGPWGGKSGEPVVAATGNTVAVVYNNGTNAQLRVSTDAGMTWAPAVDFDAGEVRHLSAAAKSGRVAWAWTSGSARSVHARLWSSGTMGAKKTIVSVNDATTYKAVNTPAVALGGTSVIGVAYSACTTVGCELGATKGSSVRWIESRNNGSTWSSSKTVGSYTASSSRRGNEFPSPLYSSSTRRIVSWNAFGATGGSLYRVLVRVGTGTP